MIYCSLKENTYYDSAINVLEYKIVDGQGDIIYYGHSIKNPKTGINRINITEIIRDYLHSNLEDNWETLSNESGYTCQQEDAYKEFSLINGELLLEKYAVLYDYVDNFNGGKKILANPINGRMDERQKLFWTMFSSGNTQINIPVDYKAKYLTFDVISGGSINLMYVNNYQDERLKPLSILYRINRGKWERGIFGTTSFNVEAGDIVEFKGYNKTYCPYVQIQITPDSYATYISYDFIRGDAKVNVYGNIMSLVYGEYFRENIGINDYSFRFFFGGFTGGILDVVSAEKLVLPSTTLKKYCYASMFSGCTSLINAPELPATTLANHCYDSMFDGCTSLTTAPSLPATALVFRCYEYMFRNCNSLNYVKCLAIFGIQAGNLGSWLSGVSSTGTFVKKQGASWPTGVSGIPEGWTVQEE